MKIKAYAVCGKPRRGKIFFFHNLEGRYAIFEKKKDALQYLDVTIDGTTMYHIETITMEVGE